MLNLHIERNPMCITICIVQFIIICLLLWPYVSRLVKFISASRSNNTSRLKVIPYKHRISAMIVTDLYNRVIRAAQEHKCTISSYITQAVQERLEREAIRINHE